jgi:putative ABC transport system permease protein
MSFLRLIGTALLRKKLRSLLTVAAIFIAFAIFGVLTSFRDALTSRADTASADRLIVTSKINFTLSLPLSYVRRAAQVEGVRTVAHATWFGGYYQAPRNMVVAFAVEPQAYLNAYPEYVLAQTSRERFLKDRAGIIIGKPLADKFGWKVGDRIPLKSNIFRQPDGSATWHFNVAGIVETARAGVDIKFAAFHHDYLDATRTSGRHMTGWLIVKARNPLENEQVARKIDAIFANSPFETDTKTEQAFNKAFTEQLGDLGFVVISIVGAAFFTILLIAGNSMMLTVRERTHEIGILKTIGFRARHIFFLVVGEAFALAAIGGVLGLAAASVVTAQIAEAMGGRIGVMVFSITTVFLGLGLVGAMGLATGLLPAWQVMRIDIVSALRRK